MKWLVLVLVLVLAFASGCHAIGDAISCSAYSDPYKQSVCRDQSRSDRAYDSDLLDQADRRAVHEHDDDMGMKREYRAALGPCAAGNARACFTTALYEDRHGAPSSRVEPRYRIACVEGIGRACFMAGAHARTRVSAEARQLALASFTHGCQLRDGESCRAGVELDPTRVDLLQTACAADYRWACTMLGR